LEGFRPGQLSKLGPYGPGLIDKLIELENAGGLLMLRKVLYAVWGVLPVCLAYHQHSCICWPGDFMLVVLRSSLSHCVL
jgi:hypothetical protein